MAPLVNWSHEARLPLRASSAEEAREFTSHHLTQHHLPYLVEDVRLVVSELVTNAVLHAQTDVIVVIQEIPFCVKLIVRDHSPELPVPKPAVQVADKGGRGLQIVDQCSIAWGTEVDADRGKAVWALFATRLAPWRSVATSIAEGSAAVVGSDPTSPDARERSPLPSPGGEVLSGSHPHEGLPLSQTSAESDDRALGSPRGARGLGASMEPTYARQARGSTRSP